MAYSSGSRPLPSRPVARGPRLSRRSASGKPSVRHSRTAKGTALRRFRRNYIETLSRHASALCPAWRRDACAELRRCTRPHRQKAQIHLRIRQSPETPRGLADRDEAGGPVDACTPAWARLWIETIFFRRSCRTIDAQRLSSASDREPRFNRMPPAMAFAGRGRCIGRHPLHRHPFPSARHEAPRAPLCLARARCGARLPRQHRRHQGAALLDRGLHRRDPLRQRAEGDPCRRRRSASRTRSTRPMAAGLRRQAPAIRKASSPSAISRTATPKPCSSGICNTRTSAASAISARADYLVNPAWRAGFKLLARHNLVSCIDTRIELFADLLALAAAFRTSSSASTIAPSRRRATTPISSAGGSACGSSRAPTMS